MSDAVARVLRKAGIAVHMKPFNTICSRLVHPKDKVLKEEKSGVVYHIACGECESFYVSETERSLKKRLTEHKRSSSSVGHHMEYHQHTFSNAEVSVVHQETGWFR